MGVDTSAAVIGVGVLTFVLVMLLGTVARANPVKLVATAVVAGFIAGVIMASALALWPNGITSH